MVKEKELTRLEVLERLKQSAERRKEIMENLK